MNELKTPVTVVTGFLLSPYINIPWIFCNSMTMLVIWWFSVNLIFGLAHWWQKIHCTVLKGWLYHCLWSSISLHPTNHFMFCTTLKRQSVLGGNTENSGNQNVSGKMYLLPVQFCEELVSLFCWNRLIDLSLISWLVGFSFSDWLVFYILFSMYYQVKRWRTSLNSSTVDRGGDSTHRRPPTRGRSSSTAITSQVADKRARGSGNQVR